MTRQMKDSGIEWIGEIPEDWEVRKLGNISKLYTGNSIKDNEKDNYISPINAIPYIATKDVGFDNKIDYDNGMYIKKDDGKFKRAYRGNTLVCIEGGSAGRKIAKIESEEVCFGNKLCCINSNVISNNYLYYYSLSPNFINGFQSRITGLIPGVTLLEMAQIEIVVPSKHKQKAIANFLDKKIQEIDNIISKTKKAIEEYKKYKQSLITETVTKGLDKNVQMKDSGIEWIGEIPEHWETIRPNKVCKVLRGNSSFQKTDLESKGDYIALQYGRTYKVDMVDDSYKYYVDKSFYKSDQIVENGDTVLISTSETMEDLGHSCFYNRDDIGLLGCEQMCLKPNKDNIQGKFLYYATKYFHIELNQYATGLKVYRFRLDDLKKINMVLPPKDEQYKIISFLDEKLPLIDQIISTKEKLLTEMEAYKKSLIYETVTGKREVE